MKNITTQGLGWVQEANGVSNESTCADNMKQYTAENCTSSYQTRVTEVVKDIRDN
jgi:hypothetical protein